MELIRPYILCGGLGKRLSPLSRAERPKPFLTLGSKTHLLEQTVERVRLDSFSAPHFIASREAARFISAPHCLVEPESRNTAASIALAALHRAQGAVLILPSDHIIKDKLGFTELIAVGMKKLDAYDVVLFGLKPTEPSTLYGYIETGEKIDDTILTLKGFTEKPNEKHARDYFTRPNFLWNMGMFLFEASKMIKLFETYQPNILKGVRDKNYMMIENISFDKAVMEKVKHAAVVEARFDWRDIGSWAQVAAQVEEVAQADTHNWGLLYSFDETARLFVVEPNKKISFREVSLPHKQELFLVVVAGSALLVSPEGERQMNTNDSFMLDDSFNGSEYKISNTSRQALKVIVVKHSCYAS